MDRFNFDPRWSGVSSRSVKTSFSACQYRRIFLYCSGPASGKDLTKFPPRQTTTLRTESLWTWIVASIAPERRAAVFVAVHASCHRDWPFFGDYVALSNGAVATLATDLRLPHVNLVREVDEIRYPVDLHPRHRLLFLPVLGELFDEGAVGLDGSVTHHAFRLGRVAHGRSRFGHLVAKNAGLNELCMELVTEGDWLGLVLAGRFVARWLVRFLQTCRQE